jgi:hypothetical protein
LDTASPAEAIATDFIRYAKSYLINGDVRSRLFPELASSGSGFRIQPGKLAPQVREILAQIHPQQHLPEVGDDFDLDSVTGGVYMAFLATRMSSDLSSQVVTHDPVFQRLIYKPLPLQQKESVNPAETTFALASLVIKSAVPTDPNSIPIESILRFREKHQGARQEFLDAVSSIGAEIDPCANEQSLGKFLNDKKSMVDQKVKGLRSSMLDVGIATTQNFIFCSVPSWITGKWALNLETGPALIAGASLSAIISLCRGYRDIKKVKRDNPWAYVLSLQKLKQRFWRNFTAAQLDYPDFFRIIWAQLYNAETFSIAIEFEP